MSPLTVTWMNSRLAHRPAAKSICLMVSVLLLFNPSCVCSASANQLAEAERLYQNKQFTEAINLVEQELKINPNNAEMRYILANCLVQVHKPGQSREQYSNSLKQSNDKTLRRYCNEALMNLNIQPDRHDPSSDKADAAQSGLKLQDAKEKSLPLIPEPDWKSLSGDDRDHIEFAETGENFERAKKDIFWAVSKMPRRFKDALWSAGVKITVCSNLSEVATVRGWKDYEVKKIKWGDLFGFTVGRNVFVAVTPGSQVRYVFKRPGMVLMHELGHAFDFNASTEKQSPEMAGPYEVEISHQLENSRWHSLSRSELFADLVAAIICQTADVYSQKGEEQKRLFPDCYAFVARRLKPFGFTE